MSIDVSPCSNCSEADKKRPRCKALQCPQYAQHLKECKELDDYIKQKNDANSKIQ